MTSGKEPTQVVILAITAIGLGLSVTRHVGAQTSYHTPEAAASRGLAATDQAARNNKYLFIFFWKDNDEQTQRMFGVFQNAMEKMGSVADWIGIPIADPKEKPLVERFGLSRAPMPLVLALAPNGAVTKGFPVQFREQDFRQALVSPCTACCMKALQERKLVLLCIGNQKTPLMQAALRGAQDFKADARFASATEIVALNPEDRREAGFLKDLQVNPASPWAITVLLAPPGRPVARFAGAVTKDQLVAKLAQAQSSCCPGGQCGPGGCGPKK